MLHHTVKARNDTKTTPQICGAGEFEGVFDGTYGAAERPEPSATREAAHEHDHARCVNLSCGQTELALARPASAAVCSAVFRGVPWRGVCARRAAAGGKGA